MSGYRPFRCTGRSMAAQVACGFTSDSATEALDHFEQTDHDVEQGEHDVTIAEHGVAGFHTSCSCGFGRWSNTRAEANAHRIAHLRKNGIDA